MDKAEEKETKVDRLTYLIENGAYVRNFQNFEAREAQPEAEGGAKELYVEGVATPFNTPTILYSYDGVDYKEQIDARAFDETNMTDVIFNYNHCGKVLARTRNSTLTLSVQADGLHMRARLDGTEEGRKLYEEIKGGYVDRMSFLFVAEESSYNETEHLRTVRKVKRLYDVSAVDIPAYDTTSISARSSFAVEIEKERKAAEAEKLRRRILDAQIEQTMKKRR